MLERDALGGAEDGVPIWELPESVIKQIERTDTETVTERIDLFIAMGRLMQRNARYVDVVVRAFVTGDWDRSKDGKELTRAVDALTREMNNTHRRRVSEYREGPGTRKVVSNSAAQAMTARQWHGDNWEGRR